MVTCAWLQREGEQSLATAGFGELALGDILLLPSGEAVDERHSGGLRHMQAQGFGEMMGF